jgi:hypothetical protein
MNRRATLILTGVIATFSMTFVAAAPPAPPAPPVKPGPIKILPMPPKPAPPVIVKPPIVIKPAPPVVVKPMPSKPSGIIVIQPQISTLRPYNPYAPWTPVLPIIQDFSIYFRFSPIDPWMLYGTTTSYWRALATRDMLELHYGLEASVW